jgi:transcriptional regulator with XRE-family HTH domain
MLTRMPTTERLRYIGARRGQRLAGQIGDEVRHARLTLGLSQSRVGEVVGVSKATISRLERGQRPHSTIVTLASVARVVGLDLVAQCYPAPTRLRDAAHAHLIARFLARIPPDVKRILEAPIRPGDLRAWDVLLRVASTTVGVAAETRLRDLQALLRREQLKQADGGVTRLLLLVAATKHNRQTLAEFRPLIREALPLTSREVMAALGRSEAPPGSGLVLL